MDDFINQAKDVLDVEDDDETKLKKIHQQETEDQLTHREELEKQEILEKKRQQAEAEANADE